MMASRLALVSLPGAHLVDLARLLGERSGWPVIEVHEAVDLLEADLTQPGIWVLPSNILETPVANRVEEFQVEGGRLIFVSMTWEDSWKAATAGMAPHESGLPWRATYRQLARERMRCLRKLADSEVSGNGTLAEVADRIESEFGGKPV